MVLSRPIQNFGDTLTELHPTRRRMGKDIRHCGTFGKNEHAKRIRLIEDVCGLARGGGAQLLGADVWGVWAEIQGFADGKSPAIFPLTLEFPVDLPGQATPRKLVALCGPDRPILGGDMIAVGECADNADAETLVYVERMCVGRDSAGAAVELTANIVDLLDGSDFDRAWVALLPFFLGMPGPQTSGSASPPSS